MRQKTWRPVTVASLLVATVAVILLCEGAAMADPNEIVATIRCSPPEQVLPGEWTCIGGTSDPVSPNGCSPETKRIQVRGAVVKWTYTAGDVESSRPDLFIGNQYATYNANYDANLQGHDWGTYVWRDGAGQLLWEGTFASIALGRHQSQWSAVAHGTGAAAGLQWKGDGTFATGLPYGIFKLRVTGTPK